MSNSVEIDSLSFLDLIRVSIRYKKIFVIFLLTFLSLAGLYNHYTSPVYEVTATFFLKDKSENNISANLGAYSSFLSAGTSNTEKYINGVFSSKKIKLKIVDLLYSQLQPQINKHIQTKGLQKKLEKAPDKTLFKKDVLLSYLNLKQKAKLEDEGKLYTLSYKCTDKNVGVMVVKSYITSFQLINEELDLIIEKNFLTIIDTPQPSKKPIRPNKPLNLAIAAFAAIILAFITAISIDYVKRSLKSSNHVPISD